LNIRTIKEVFNGRLALDFSGSLEEFPNFKMNFTIFLYHVYLLEAHLYYIINREATIRGLFEDVFSVYKRNIKYIHKLQKSTDPSSREKLEIFQRKNWSKFSDTLPNLRSDLQAILLKSELHEIKLNKLAVKFLREFSFNQFGDFPFVLNCDLEIEKIEKCGVWIEGEIEKINNIPVNNTPANKIIEIEETKSNNKMDKDKFYDQKNYDNNPELDKSKSKGKEKIID